MHVQYPVSFVVDGDAFIAVIGIPSASSTSRPLRDQIAPAHQVVGGGTEAKQPVDEPSAAVAQFAEERDRLQPTERLLNELPLSMTEPIAGVSGRARVDRAAAVPEFVLGHVRRDAQASNGRDPGTRVVGFVGAGGHASMPPAETAPDHVLA